MKKFIALLLSLAMVLSLCSLTACGKRGGEDDTNKEGETADAKYTLTIGHVYTEDSIEHKQMAKIKELVEEKTNGACQVKIFANEQLGDEQNIAEQCVTGACDMGFSEGSVWATVTNKPEFAVFGLPSSTATLTPRRKSPQTSSAPSSTRSQTAPACTFSATFTPASVTCSASSLPSRLLTTSRA